jgi:hypothetical protein
MVLGERGDDERHAGWPGVVFQNRSANRTEESFFVDIYFVLLRSVTVAHVGA